MKRTARIQPYGKTIRVVAVVQCRAMGELGRSCLLCLVVCGRMSHVWPSSVSPTLIILLL